MSTYRSPSRTRKAQQAQPHGRDWEGGSEQWLAAPEAESLDSWFPIKTCTILPTSSAFLPSHDQSLLPTLHKPCGTCPGLTGLPAWPTGSCVEVGVVPAVSFCVWKDGVHSDPKSFHQPSKRSLPRMKSWSAWDFKYLTWPSLGSQTLPSLLLLLGGKRGICISLPPPPPCGWPP